MAGRVHALTVRDVNLLEAGEVKLTAKDFQTQAKLIVKGWITSDYILPHGMIQNNTFFNLSPAVPQIVISCPVLFTTFRTFTCTVVLFVVDLGLLSAS